MTKKIISKDYFADYIKGEVYNYGLKCASPLFESDEREVVFVAQGEEKKIHIVHDSNSRKFLQVHVATQARAEIEIILIAKPLNEALDRSSICFNKVAVCIN